MCVSSLPSNVLEYTLYCAHGTAALDRHQATCAAARACCKYESNAPAADLQDSSAARPLAATHSAMGQTWRTWHGPCTRGEWPRLQSRTAVHTWPATLQRPSGPLEFCNKTCNPDSGTHPAKATETPRSATSMRRGQHGALRPGAAARAGPRQAAYVICSRLGLSVTVPGLFLDASWRASCGGMSALLSSSSRLRS